jgi:acylphosphatase
VNTLHLLIRGKVQGVGFRYAMCRQAEKLGISGWVRNCADGSVEAVIAGDETAVDAILAWCQRGPPQSRVEGVQQAPATGTFKGFVTRY